MDSKFFKAIPINDHVTRIEGFAMGENCYLVQGSERALLIDGLLGVGYLRQFVRELTDLPVTMVLTHGHIDHSGAVWEYRECYVHPDDMALTYARGNEKKRLEKGQQVMASVTASDVPAVVPSMLYPVVDGDVFDLGDRQLEVIEVPGHSKGSIVLLDRADRVVYAGDACFAGEPVRMLFANSSTSVEEYKKALERLRTFEPYFDVIWNGHDHEAADKKCIEETIKVCELIMEGKDEKVARKVMGCDVCFAYGDKTLPNIIYFPDNIFQKDEKQVIKGRPIVFS